MKRVLLCVHKFFPDHKAGTEVLTLKVAQELLARGHEVLVVTCNPPDLNAGKLSLTSDKLTSDYVYEGIPVHAIEEALRLKDYTFAHEYNHAAVVRHFDQVLAKFSPDILHIFHAQNLSAGIIEAAKARGIPAVISATDFWFVCPIVQLVRPGGKLCSGPEKLAANCLSCYTPRLFAPQAEFEAAMAKKYKPLSAVLALLPRAGANLFWTFLYRLYELSKLKGAVSATVKRPDYLRHAANQAKAIMVPTGLMRKIFVENGIDAGLISHVPFGIDTKPFEAFREKGKGNFLRIGYIGTLSAHKGVDLLLEAYGSLCKKLPGKENLPSLTIYGDPAQFPEYGASLIEQAGKIREGKIAFAGTFPNKDLARVLSGIDVLVVPSRWYENTPLVIQSALASKTPLIVTDLGGMSEIVKHNINGLVFKLNDASALEAQLARLIDEPDLLKRLTDGIEPERTVSDMVDDIEAVYARILSPGPANQGAPSQAMVS